MVTEDNTGGAIVYDPVTGTFTINETGMYFVVWSVATDGAGPATQIIFDLQLNGASVAESATPALTGLLTGAALVNVVAAPSTLQLVNTTGSGVFVPATDVQSNIVIYKVGP